MEKEKTPSELRLEQHKKDEAVREEKAKKKLIRIAMQKKKWQKQVDAYIKKNPKKKGEKMIFLNTKKAGPKASDWLKKVPLSSVTEEDLEKEVAFGFDR